MTRELGIRPDMLRTWKRQAESRAGLTSEDLVRSAPRARDRTCILVSELSPVYGDELSRVDCAPSSGSPDSDLAHRTAMAAAIAVRTVEVEAVPSRPSAPASRNPLPTFPLRAHIAVSEGVLGL